METYALAPRINGHRGHSHTAPENTLPALIAAKHLGASAIECDVRMSADGHLVLMHDATLRRTTNVAEVFPSRADARIEEFTAEELCALDAGCWKGPLWEGTPIPFLADALKAMRSRSMPLIIELKSGTQDPLEIAAAVRDCVGRTDDITFISFDRSLLAGLTELMPHARQGLVSVRPPATNEAALYDEVHLDSRFVTSSVINRMHAVGTQVTTWTVDKPARAARLAELGVDAITTNRVGIIRETLDRQALRTANR